MKALAAGILCILAMCSRVPCASEIDFGKMNENSELNKAFEDAQKNGDYRKMVTVAKKLARDGNDEHVFAVGYTIILWSADKNAKEPSPYKPRDALPWIYRAAKKGLPQAIETLQNAYEFGDLSLPKNPDIAACWSEVLEEKHDIDSCLKLETQSRAHHK